MTVGVSDEESLLMQLCEYLHDSGFLFNDASQEEVAHGQGVIEDFFEQEGALVMAYLSEELLGKFVGYVQAQSWSQDEMEPRLRRKIVKTFDQLAQGTSHSWNLSRNIHLGLLQFPQHTLQDFLLYLTAYHQLVLEESEPPKSEEVYTVNDLMRLRQELVERLEGRKLVELLLGDISRQRGGHMPLEEKNIRTPITFVRPNQTPQKTTRPLAQRASAPATSKKPSSPQGKNQANPVEMLEESFQDHVEELDFQEEKNQGNDDEANVVYGTGAINQEATSHFIQQHTDSALKYLFRKDLTEKALPMDVVNIHEQWERRGLKRKVIRGYILEIMGWEKLPKEQTLLELSGALKDRIYDLLHGGL